MHRAAPLAPPAIAVGPVLKRAQGLPSTVAASLAERVASCPDGVLWTYDPVGNHRSQTHSQAWQRSGAIAAALQQLGGRAGQPVVLVIRDVVDFVPAFWACLRGGFVSVPLNGVAEEALQTDGHTPLRNMLERLNYPILLFDEHFHRLGNMPGLAAAVALADVEADAESCRDAGPADPACLVPTSGSTGRQRLVALGPDAILHRFFAGSAAMTKPLTSLSAFPLDRITGLRAAYLGYGGWVQLSPTILFGRPLSLLDAIERFRVGRVSMTSSMAARVLTAGDDSGGRADLRSLRQFDLGAEPVVPEMARRLERLLAEHGAPAGIIRAGYGTTETGPLVLGDDPVASASGDDGLAPLGGCAPGVSIRIVGDHDEILAEGAIGQVQALCSQTIFAGYWGEPEASRDGFTADHWWKTGDLGRLRDGNLTLHGRSKEVLIVRGRKHSLAEIDAHLEEEVGPGIRTFSCAVHWPNEPTERLAVVFATAPGALDRDTDVAGRIRRAVARRFGLDARPVIAASLERIPFTATGKLRRFELAEGVRFATLGADARSWSRDTIPETVERPNEPALWRIWREALGIEGELDPEASFFDLGGDSLCSVRLLTEVELRFGRSVPLVDFFAAPTLARLRQLVDDTGSPPTAGAAPSDAIPWPLPPELHHRLNSYFATWDGQRPTRDRLVAGLNTAGARPPLF